MARLRVESGTFAMKGVRPTMEDEHISLDDISEEYPQFIEHFQEPLAYYGIYDGHRGIRAAEYAAEYLHTNILEHPDFVTDTEKAIREAFIKTDDDFLDKARKQADKWNDGCTAVVAIFLGTKLYVANCGDAEILLGRKKEDSEEFEAVELTHKHKPSDPVEKDRIRAAGGMVLAGRVGGALAVARAFGDLEFKTPFQDGDLHIGKLITADPYIAAIDLIPNRDLFLIVGCDGVWERMGHQDSVSFVSQHLSEEGPEITSEMLVNRAFSKKSQDNISSTIVSLTWGDDKMQDGCDDDDVDDTSDASDASDENDENSEESASTMDCDSQVITDEKETKSDEAVAEKSDETEGTQEVKDSQGDKNMDEEKEEEKEEKKEIEAVPTSSEEKPIESKHESTENQETPTPSN